MVTKDSDSRILLFSSGLDSYIAWHYLGKPPCLHITGHSRYSFPEYMTIQLLLMHNLDLKVSFVNWKEWLQKFEEPDATIHLRNAHFVLVAAHFGDHILLGHVRKNRVNYDFSIS